MIATQPALGVNYPSRTYKYMVIASPAAAYFGGGQARHRLALHRVHPRRPRRHRLRQVRRQLRGGLRRPAPGRRAGLRPGGLARRGRAPLRRGDGRDEPVLRLRCPPALTPALTGTLLPGITRDSLLTLAADLGLTAEEGRLSIEEWQRGLRVRRAHRGLRLRHRRGRSPRSARSRAPTAPGRSATAPRARSPPGSARSWWASSTVPAPTRTAGSTRSARGLAHTSAWFPVTGNRARLRNDQVKARRHSTGPSHKESPASHRPGLPPGAGPIPRSAWRCRS